MSKAPITSDEVLEEQHELRPYPRAADYFWRPWYAKLWWTAIPFWWIGMAASAKIEPLAEFYSSAPAGFLNILFFPMTALMVLGLGYAQMRLAVISSQSSGQGALEFGELDPGGVGYPRRMYGQPHPSVDIYDPRSGTFYIGNPSSFQHPNRR